mmetsp:Transcript_69283/g.120116  ORF Transcript_69283/g.120116 Transcript_69283/m.120116 type:complete len:189 (+) Transcript_69283:89-655(+)
MSYYETMDGLKVDKAIVDACREAVKGKGDGRVSVDDAKSVLEKASDGGTVTQVERWTIRYCLTEFNWTEAAVDYFKDELEKVPQEDGEPEEPALKKAKMQSYYETIDGLKLDRKLVDACRDAVAGQGDGRVSVEDAKSVLEKAADGGKVTRVERWTIRYCLTVFNWTEAALDFFCDELKKVPQEDEEE